MKRSGLTLTEIMIAISMAVVVMIPMMSMFSASGQAVQKTRNFSFASGLARRISQHLMIMPFADVEEVPLPGISLCDAPDDPFFNPFLNFQNDQNGLKRINNTDFPELYGFLNQFDFRYSISVSNVSFGAGDEIKSVAIQITWKEAGKDMIYRTHVYIPSI
jgi:hypothetical protein